MHFWHLLILVAPALKASRARAISCYIRASMLIAASRHYAGRCSGYCRISLDIRFLFLYIYFAAPLSRRFRYFRARLVDIYFSAHYMICWLACHDYAYSQLLPFGDDSPASLPLFSLPHHDIFIVIISHNDIAFFDKISLRLSRPMLRPPRRPSYGHYPSCSS